MTRYVKQIACRFHPGSTLIEDARAGDMICPECGLVVGERMVDVGSEWRTFSNDDGSKNMSRIGGPENALFGTDDLHTTMSTGTGAGAVDEFGQQKYKNGSRQISSVDKALKTGHHDIREMAGKLSLSGRIIQRAFLIYKQCYETKCVRGHSQDAIIASCIYIACREEKSQHTLKEICAVAKDSSKVEIGRCFQRIKNKLLNSIVPEALDSKNLIPRFCNRLTLGNTMLVTKTSIHILERAKELCDIQSRAPDSIAGAVIYMACAALGERTSMKELQDATGAVESTLRQVYKKILPNAKLLFPSDCTFKCSPENLPLS
ncbi:hypothetical protein I4U23_017647 [Adineta vaga]|nr:hypothetical protein I4U23_017647 [Adineta vaga]